MMYFFSSISSRILVYQILGNVISGLNMKILFSDLKCVGVPVKLRVSRSHTAECKLNAEGFGEEFTCFILLVIAQFDR